MIYSKFTVADSTEDTEEISIKAVAFPCTVKPVYRMHYLETVEVWYVVVLSVLVLLQVWLLSFQQGLGISDLTLQKGLLQGQFLLEKTVWGMGHNLK
jgi:hypothetical protein